jgi:ribokinase
VRLAVVGHVEWVEFVRVERVPQPGEIVHAVETWEEAGGGGAVAAVQLARLNGSALLFTSLGDDELAQRSRAELAVS